MTPPTKQGPQTLEDLCDAELNAPVDPQWAEIIRLTTEVKVILANQHRDARDA